jgi:hypothetical protein
MPPTMSITHGRSSESAPDVAVLFLPRGRMGMMFHSGFKKKNDVSQPLVHGEEVAHQLHRSAAPRTP